MEHVCAKCGASVEEGIPFCPSCNAPQIRVSIQPPASETPAPLASAPKEIEGPEGPAPHLPVPEDSSRRVRWAEARRGIATAGILLAVSMLVPLVSPVLLMFAAGALSAFLYIRRSHLRITAGAGARVGAAAGVVGFVLLVVVMVAQILVAGGRILPLLREAIQEQLARNPNPRAQELLDQLTTPGGLALILGLGMILFLIAVVILSGLGGAIVAWFMGRRNRQPQ